MKVLLCGGGTAGHVNPALAIAEAIKKEYKDSDFLFIGREGGFENQSVKKANIPQKTLKVEGLRRGLTVKNARKLLLALKAIKQAKLIISEFSPDVVVATGGYVSWPVIKAAERLRIPVVIHESNAYPGLVTRLVASKCKFVLLNHEKTAEYLKRKDNIAVIGNPIRSDFSSISRRAAREELKLNKNDCFILSFGGSIGAEKLNDVITGIMSKNIKSMPSVRHLHATGKKHFAKYRNCNLAGGVSECKITPYIDDMPKKLMAADIVICRSGAITLSELAVVGVAAILIPSPNVTDNHQYKNAKLISDAGACVMIEEGELTEELLLSKIKELINDKTGRLTMAKEIKKFATKNAAELASEKIVEAARRL